MEGGIGGCCKGSSLPPPTGAEVELGADEAAADAPHAARSAAPLLGVEAALPLSDAAKGGVLLSLLAGAELFSPPPNENALFVRLRE